MKRLLLPVFLLFTCIAARAHVESSLDGAWSLKFFPQGPADSAVAFVPVELAVAVLRGFRAEANTATATPVDPGAGQGVLLIEYTVDGVRRVNHYLYGEPPFRLADYRKWIRKAKIPGLE